MKGIVTCAGIGSRLGMGNKSFVKYKGKMIIKYIMDNFIEIGIKDVIIVQRNEEIREIFGYKYKSLFLDYVNQDKPSGIAHAIALTEEKIKGDNVCIILGDIIFTGSLKSMKRLFDGSNSECIAGFKIVKDKELIKKSYGLNLDLDKMFFEEKPKEVKNHYLGLGIYMSKNSIFDAIRKTPRSELRNEIEITDTLNNMSTLPFILEGVYKNINYPEDLK